MDNQNSSDNGAGYGESYNSHGSVYSTDYVDASANHADVSEVTSDQNENDDSQNYYSYGKEEDVRGDGQNPSGVRTKQNTGQKIARFAVIAVVFGVISGAVFTGTTFFLNQAIGNNDSSQSITSDSDVNRPSITIGEQTSEQNVVSDQEDANALAGAVTDVSGVAAEVMPAIVSITNEGLTTQYDFFGESQEYQSESIGSGIIVTQDDEYLYIATNNHVIADAQSLSVTFVDDSTVSAEIKGTDAATDLAVVRVKLKDISNETKSSIRTATFGDSSDLKVGESAIAIGNALGYGQSVTTGVISAVDREVEIQSELDGSTIKNLLIQTDAAINPGNSGGALLNMQGEVIGINSAKYSDTSVEGMGYAIPSATAIPIIEQLITREVVDASDTGYLGISGIDVTDAVASTYNMPGGIYITQVVPGEAAEAAGIINGDIITSFDGRTITSMEDMQELLQYYAAGQTIEVKVQRAIGGEYQEIVLELTLGTK
ncbi:MAG: S1C family serine protease [Lachnospiraceae bacterium]